MALLLPFSLLPFLSLRFSALVSSGLVWPSLGFPCLFPFTCLLSSRRVALHRVYACLPACLLACLLAYLLACLIAGIFVRCYACVLVCLFLPCLPVCLFVCRRLTKERKWYPAKHLCKDAVHASSFYLFHHWPSHVQMQKLIEKVSACPVECPLALPEMRRQSERPRLTQR